MKRGYQALITAGLIAAYALGHSNGKSSSQVVVGTMADLNSDGIDDIVLLHKDDSVTILQTRYCDVAASWQPIGEGTIDYHDPVKLPSVNFLDWMSEWKWRPHFNER
ncbi:hypothetical protein H6503_06470 [Candidatus Woesearchaeota archaeon]|nr:hypothetical protein [Candidatus Woesearchaeota archaeon]